MWNAFSQILEDRLDKIESRCQKVLKKAGYSSDSKMFSGKGRWTTLNTGKKSKDSHSSLNENIRRAASTLLLVDQLRQALAAGYTAKASWYALTLGSSQTEITAEVNSATVNRKKTFKTILDDRPNNRDNRVIEAKSLADKINRERAHAHNQPRILTPAALAHQIKKRGSDKLKKLSVRTIQSYLTT